ncbi:trypsin-like peptidase domain-containing protein [Streptomyces sp. NPDC047071]|uniref:S1C family serine protease n=1 Tax=Streptomyces sp. NPDC047071 TaxID=3154808 RepID=UPI003451A0C8
MADSGPGLPEAAPGAQVAPAADSHPGAPDATPAAPGSPAAPAPGSDPGRTAAPAPPAPATPAAAPAAAPAPVQPPADRPQPLHEPDPYSTPPYGGPGPWAPAPPVQHPGTTPAHGTPAPGAPAPAAIAPGAAPAAPAAPDAPTPWQRYDPWSVAPLQQTGAAVETREQRRRRGRRALVAGAAFIALVAGGIGGAVGAYLEREGGIGGGGVELPQAGAESPTRPKGSVAGIAASALPGVVTLHVRGDDGAGTGTGFVLDGKGHILTNNHVVEPAGTGGEISVTFSGGETARAKVIGRDSGYDLAVVKVTRVRGLRPLPLGNSENVQVGDPVVAIGAPFDLANTVTSGIISAKERPITAGGEKGDGSDVSYVNALQTDAPINPGNSGGPLVDSKARVIGINSAIRSADGGSESEGGQAGSIGLGFAIPINQGKRVAEELINTGRATHPVIGVTIDKRFTGDGARIASKSQNGGPAVTRGGPGAKAGLRPGDVITEVDGRAVHSGDELIVKVRAHRPGDRLELTVERGGDERTVTLVLGSASGD